VILLTRIDDRLIHGQVVEGWVNYLKATCILVADDTVAVNPVQRSILEISAPEGLTVIIGSVDDICRKLSTASLVKERAILLFSNPRDVLAALGAGLACTSVNLGGMHFVPGKRKILDVLAVDDADEDAFRKIMQRGVKIEVQTVPTEKPQPLEKVLQRLERQPGGPPSTPA
jgi:mannose/fructose/N-acetylgalactosamine-specific phosphotransferase system component IIB